MHRYKAGLQRSRVESAQDHAARIVGAVADQGHGGGGLAGLGVATTRAHVLRRGGAIEGVQT